MPNTGEIFKQLANVSLKNIYSNLYIIFIINVNVLS